MKVIRIFAIAAVVFVFTHPGTRAAGALRPELNARLAALHESNIYHAYADSDHVASILNVFDLSADWRLRQGPHLNHEIVASAGLEVYPNYSKRNRSSIGLSYEPTFRYGKRGRFILDAAFSRQDKELIDDAGQVSARNLQKWEAHAELTHRYDFGRVRADASFGYFDDNYDETDTLATNGVDTMMVHLQSYDYHAWVGGLDIHYDLTDDVRVRGIFTSERRYYDERRTYTVQYGAVTGRPFEVRNFRENTVTGELRYRPSESWEITLSTEFARRTDNFENFYGYDQWQHKIKARVSWSRRQKSSISFRFKTKDYPNYYTGRIPDGNRVSIDYADLEIEHGYRITPQFSVTAYLRNYNKVSNDPLFDYHDVTAGVGFGLTY